jgi:hypothetical protein
MLHKSIDINEINGDEIVEFLNEKSKNPDVEWHHEYNVVTDSFSFVDQKVQDNAYVLDFGVEFNNWGENFPCNGNSIRITPDGISVELGEFLEGQGFEEELEEILMEWLSTHVFDNDVEKTFYSYIAQSFDELSSVKYNEGKEYLQRIIDKLTRAKNLIK